MEKLMEALFRLSKNIRYIAIYRDGKLDKSSRAGLAGESSSESDKYEELIVNPTLLKLITQRGNIDCGGVNYVVIRYGNFFQILFPTTSGHLSVSVEPKSNPLELIEPVRSLLKSFESAA